jgi:hypothetical protein
MPPPFDLAPPHALAGLAQTPSATSLTYGRREGRAPDITDRFVPEGAFDAGFGWRRDHQAPVLPMDAQGSAGGRAWPF